MLIFALTILFFGAAMAALVSLADTAIRGKKALFAITRLQAQKHETFSVITIREVTGQRQFAVTRLQRPTAFTAQRLRVAA